MQKALDILPLNEWGLFDGAPAPLVIAGPCSAESPEQMMDTARGLRKAGVAVFRAGLWKPRTHPGSFEGVGSAGLEWLREVRKETGMKVSTEVALARHVQECLESGVDMVWIGARTTANPFLVQEIAQALRGCEIPVLVKNPVNPDLELWVGALERLNAAGVRRLGVVHRGFSSFENISYRNAPQWQIALQMRSLYPKLPFFCDPSHIAGDAALVPEIAQKAVDMGIDGLMVESHCDPAGALSDASQQLTPAALASMLSGLAVRSSDCEDEEYRSSINALRARIDELDRSLIAVLAERMEVSRAIGQRKRDRNISIVQASRWEEVLEHAVSAGLARGLDPDFVRNVFNRIHEASVGEQNKILKKQ